MRMLQVLDTDCKFNLQGALSGLRQFLATESSLKMMKNAFYFTLQLLFILKIFKSLWSCAKTA